HRGATAATTTSASVRRSTVMRSRATDRRSASKCQGDGQIRPSTKHSGCPRVPVGVRTSRLSCKRAGKTRSLLPVWDSSGESRLKGAEALYVCGDPLVSANRVRIVTFALTARLPTMYDHRGHVEAGGLMCYGPNFPELWRRTAEMVDKILRGARPAGLPVEQPNKFELVVSSTHARALGLTIPESFLPPADAVIQCSTNRPRPVPNSSAPMMIATIGVHGLRSL